MDQAIGGIDEAPMPDQGAGARKLAQKRRPQRRFTSLAGCLAADIPVYIPTFNNPTYASRMVRQLKAWGVRNIVIIDNASSSPAMLDFLDDAQGDAKVVFLPDNRGPQDAILSDATFPLLPDVFCVTDPDLEFNEAMPQDFLYTLLTLTHEHGVGKAGLALNLADRHMMKEERFPFGGHLYQIWEWESQFWTRPAGALADGSAVFRANIDTTFALYNKQFFRRETFYDAVRVAGRYTCRHLPWYRDTGIPGAEESFYKTTQKHSYHMR